MLPPVTDPLLHYPLSISYCSRTYIGLWGRTFDKKQQKRQQKVSFTSTSVFAFLLVIPRMVVYRANVPVTFFQSLALNADYEYITDQVSLRGKTGEHLLFNMRKNGRLPCCSSSINSSSTKQHVLFRFFVPIVSTLSSPFYYNSINTTTIKIL